MCACSKFATSKRAICENLDPHKLSAIQNIQVHYHCTNKLQHMGEHISISLSKTYINSNTMPLTICPSKFALMVVMLQRFSLPSLPLFCSEGYPVHIIMTEVNIAQQ